MLIDEMQMFIAKVKSGLLTFIGNILHFIRDFPP